MSEAVMELAFGSSGGSEAPGLTGWLLLAVNQGTFSFWLVCWHCAPHLHESVRAEGSPSEVCVQAEVPINPALQPLSTRPTAPAGQTWRSSVLASENKP